MTHITDYGGAIDDYYPARMERIKDMELTELEKRADIEAEESRMKPEALDGGWQPIETAPKDLVLVMTKSGTFHTAYWDNYSGGTWWISGTTLSITPTHWMPIPKTPS